MLFQERDRLQEERVDFLLFVKEKLPFGTDPQKDEWIYLPKPLVRWKLSAWWGVTT